MVRHGVVGAHLSILALRPISLACSLLYNFTASSKSNAERRPLDELSSYDAFGRRTHKNSNSTRVGFYRMRSNGVR